MSLRTIRAVYWGVVPIELSSIHFGWSSDGIGYFPPTIVSLESSTHFGSGTDLDRIDGFDRRQLFAAFHFLKLEKK